MKTNHLVAMLILSSTAVADEPTELRWPIADPFAAFEAIGKSAVTGTLTTRVAEADTLAGRVRGAPSPFPSSFVCRVGESFFDFVSRATVAVAGKSADFATLSVGDQFGAVICRFGFAVRHDTPVEVDIRMHLGTRQRAGDFFVPIDVPEKSSARRAFVRVPTSASARVLPDGGVVPVPAEPPVRGIAVRRGRAYFPWFLVGDDQTEVAVESAKPDGSIRYLRASTRGADRGRVTDSARPPAWWPTGSPEPLVLSGAGR